VARVAANAIVANVIYLLLAGNEPEEMRVADKVNRDRLPIQGHSAVAAASTAS
jgi:hypothetical protein